MIELRTGKLSLTPGELQEADAWRKALDSIVLKSPKLCSKDIVLRVIANNKIPLNPSSSFNTITITRDCLSISGRDKVAVREYLLAHELGHIEGGHTWMSGLIAVMLTVGLTMALIALVKSMVIFFLGCTVACASLVLLWGYDRLMCFEWGADKRGERFIGRKKMLYGMTCMRARRSVEDNAFYDNKIDKMCGKRPSRRKPA